MNKMKDLNDFKIPSEPGGHAGNATEPAKVTSDGLAYRLHQKSIAFCKKHLGETSKVTQFMASLKTDSFVSGDDVVDALSQIKRLRSAKNRLHASLTIALIITLLLTWQLGLPMLAEADQLRNDIGEQEQIMEIEKKNNEFLETWAVDKEKLEEGIRTVYAAIPESDEKAEDVISMLEDVGRMNGMIIDAIGIRKVSESQMYYDDLAGVVDIYEYTFTLEDTLPSILSFIRSLRQSLRLMDIMAMEIEENKGLYRASFLLHAYHLTELSPNEPIE